MSSGQSGDKSAQDSNTIIMEDPINWLEYSEEMRMEELLKYHQQNKIKGYSYQTSLL